MVCYGGGHVNIIASVYSELVKHDNVDITILALTMAPQKLKKLGIPHMTISEALNMTDEKECIMTLGEEIGSIYHNPESGIAYEDTIAYYGLGYYDLISQYGKDKAAELFGAHGRKAFLPVETMEKIISKIAPDKVVVTTSPRVEEATGIAANRLGIPVVRINDLPVTPKVPYDCTMCVMNEWAKDYAVNTGALEEDKIVVTGQPVFEDELKPDWEKIEEVKRRLELEKYESCVVFFTQPGMKQNKIIDALYMMAQNNPTILFIVKMHPNQDKDEIVINPAKNVRIEVDYLLPILYIADIAITAYSTTGLEAALLDKPLVVVNPEKERLPLDYAAIGIGVAVEEVSYLSFVVKELLDVKSDLYTKLKHEREKFRNFANSKYNIVNIIISDD